MAVPQNALPIPNGLNNQFMYGQNDVTGRQSAPPGASVYGPLSVNTRQGYAMYQNQAEDGRMRPDPAYGWVPTTPSSGGEQVSATSSAGGSLSKRPRLTVQIPQGESTADGNSGGNQGSQGRSHNRHASREDNVQPNPNTGVYLPPPSPSNPTPMATGFPPMMAGGQHANGRMNGAELPSGSAPYNKFNGELLPSPSNIFSEWSASFGRAGDAMIPSPINFQTPLTSTAPTASLREQIAKRDAPAANTEMPKPATRSKRTRASQ